MAPAVFDLHLKRPHRRGLQLPSGIIPFNHVSAAGGGGAEAGNEGVGQHGGRGCAGDRAGQSQCVTVRGAKLSKCVSAAGGREREGASEGHTWGSVGVRAGLRQCNDAATKWHHFSTV